MTASTKWLSIGLVLLLHHFFSLAILATDDKNMKSLATLTCTVLRTALPKIPLPITCNGNPIEYTLPGHSTSDTPVGSAVELMADPSGLLHTTVSAPQLITSDKSINQPLIGLSQVTTATCYGSDLSETQTTTLFPEFPVTMSSPCHTTTAASPCHTTVAPFPCHTSRAPSSYHTTTVSPPCHTTATPVVVEKATSNIPLVSESSSPSGSMEHTLSQEELALYDKFFPELEEVTELTKSQSSPQLLTEGGSVQNVERLQLTGEIESNTSPVRCLPSHPPLLVIPTAESLTEPNNHNTEITGAPSPDKDGTDVVVTSVLTFNEIPSPQVYGHD